MAFLVPFSVFATLLILLFDKVRTKKVNTRFVVLSLNIFGCFQEYYCA